MATHYKGEANETIALDLFIKLMRASGAVLQEQEKYFKEHGLTSGQFGALETLFHLGPLCQKELAGKLLFSEGNVTHIIDNLEKRELAKRVMSEKDRRYFLINLTEKGEKLMKKIFPEFVKHLSDHLAVLTSDEQIQLANMCKKLGQQQISRVK